MNSTIESTLDKCQPLEIYLTARCW